jgi:hypothetical protein
MTVFSGQKARASDYNNLLNENSPLPLGIIARGNRTTNSTTTTTEVGVLRLDDIPMYADRTYKIWTSALTLDTSVAADVAAANLRYTTDGSTPTTSSTILTAAQAPLANATSGNSVTIIIDYSPATDTLFSVLLTVTRVSGTGNISIAGAATAPIDMVIEDIGQDPTDTGVDI